MDTLTIISIVVGVAGLVVGVLQIVLTFTQNQKSKKFAVKLATVGDFV